MQNAKLQNRKCWGYKYGSDCLEQMVVGNLKVESWLVDFGCRKEILLGCFVEVMANYTCQ